MTTRRRNSDDAPEGYSIKLGNKEISLVTAAFILILSATPFGQQALKLFGVAAPATQEIQQVQLDIRVMKNDLAEIKAELDALKKRVIVTKN